MHSLIHISGPAASLPLDSVDTEQIIRIERLLGEFAFEGLRYLPDGSEDPAFELNCPTYRTAPILVASRNFGCGSSGESAVWALAARGIRCVIAECFGEIFFYNCFQNGVLPIRLSTCALEQVRAAAGGGLPLTVNLLDQVITLPCGGIVAFQVDPIRRQALLDGVDDIDRTLTRSQAIAQWEARDRAIRPWAW